MCEECHGKFHDFGIGTCAGCEGPTTSTSFVYCDGCAEKKDVCVACGAPSDGAEDPPHIVRGID